MSLFNTLLRLGIISSISDREKFIHKTSQLIEQYYDDPEAAERLAKGIAMYLEDMKDNINMRRAVNNSLNRADVATKEDIEELHKMLKDLVSEVRKQNGKHSDDGVSED
jgi:uncharacterized membrane-anchored protein YjiN (DUF445 family)